MHTHRAHHRFPIFPNQDTPPTHSPPKRSFHIDLHTSQYPIIACGCTRLRDLFGTEGDARVDTSIVLYAVKRQAEAGEAAPRGPTVSRERTYLFDHAWQPTVHQTTRGMAALLSCLYCLAHLISLKGVAVESSVLSILHQITFFPPAVRARESLQPVISYRSISSFFPSVGILFLNRDVRSEERAALSEAIYHALKDFLSGSCRGPAAIISNPNRFFEAVSFLLLPMASHSLMM
jgi:hypothetical protein